MYLIIQYRVIRQIYLVSLWQDLTIGSEPRETLLCCVHNKANRIMSERTNRVEMCNESKLT